MGLRGSACFPSGLGNSIIKKMLQGTGVEWHGFHAFRRGLGTRLYNNGTSIETVPIVKLNARAALEPYKL